MDNEILKKVRKIEIKTNKLVNEVFGGEYRSVFRGQGIEFSEVRPYNYGDDSRLIDWKVTARERKPYVKIFSETRELSILILYDVSSSTYFSATADKKEIAGEIASILSFSALKNGDKTGLALFSDRIEKYIPISKGKKHVLTIIEQILNYKPQNVKTDIKTALSEINRYLKRKTIIFLISDFYDEGFEKELKIVAKKHDLIGIRLYDIAEKSLDLRGIVPIRDAETGNVRFVRGKKYRNNLEQLFLKKEEELKMLFNSAKADFISIDIAEDYYPVLYNFFRNRERRFR